MLVPPLVNVRLRLIAMILVLASGLAGAQEFPDPEEPLVVSRALVPAIGQIGGFKGVVWRSDVALHNDSPTEVTVVVHPLGVPELFQMMTLAPGESTVFTNVAADSFGISSRVLPLLVQTLARRSITVYATAWGIVEGRPTPHQIIPVLYEELLISTAQRLASLQMNEDARSNVGLINLNQQPVTFSLALERLEGRPLATLNVTVGPESSIHVPLNVLFPMVTEGSGLTLVVDSIAPRTWAYASVVKNDTHEATFVLPFISVR